MKLYPIEFIRSVNGTWSLPLSQLRTDEDPDDRDKRARYEALVMAFPRETAPRYLLSDRDDIFGHSFVDQVTAMGLVDGWVALERAYIERVIGTIRRECLDHVIDHWQSSPPPQSLHLLLSPKPNAPRTGQGRSGAAASPRT